MTTANTVGSGKYTYTLDENWVNLPDGWEMPAAAVAIQTTTSPRMVDSSSLSKRTPHSRRRA